MYVIYYDNRFRFWAPLTLPKLEEYYHLTYTVVALLFLSPLFGYTASALLNPMVHDRLGQRGVGIIAGLCHMIAYIVAAVHPPFPVIVVFFVLAGFGNGLADAGWNAWIGNMANANEVLGFLHGFYGLGATIAPLIATSMITKGNLPWYYYYYLMVSRSRNKAVHSTYSLLQRLAWQVWKSQYQVGHSGTQPAQSTAPTTLAPATQPATA
jgi:fucose permease